MKKRALVLLLCAVMALGLSACGKGTTPPESAVSSADVSASASQPDVPAGPAPGTALNTFYEAVLAAQPTDADELIFFEESDPNLINSFYPGLESVELSQKVFYMPPIATHPCEIVLVEVADEADVQTVEDVFHARIELGADDTTYPESAAGWQRYAQVQQSGNFVCMIVLPQGYVIPENVFEL